MAGFQARFVPILVTVASVLLGPVQSSPSPSTIPTSRGPPPLPQYYPTSSQRPPSTTSSLAPTAPIVYSAQRIRPSYNSAEDDEPYPASAHLGTARTTSGVANDEQPDNAGFVEPIDFGSLLKDVGSSPKTAGLDIGASNSNPNPLFASESKDTFAGFFGSTKNPFEELTRLNTASSDHNSRQHNSDEDNVGFVDPNVQFRSLFDSTGASSGFKPEDFLGSKSENVGSDPSKGSQTRAYPSFTYSGRQEADREDDDYGRGGGGGGPNRYRSSYRQVGNNHYNPDAGRGGHYDDDRISHDSPPTDSYEDDGSYYNRPPPPNSGPGPSPRGGGRDYERATPRYSQAAQETSHSPQTKPRTASTAESKNPKCKKVEKQVDYSEDYASFTEPEADYDPSTYQGRYKRQSRQGRQGGRGGPAKRPMTCYVCEDEHGRYAEKCSYDSNGSPKNGAYFHSESSSFSDNGRRPKSGSGGSKDRHRRNPSVNRQRQVDTASSESTTKAVSAAPEITPEIGESEAKVIDKRQSGGGFGGDRDEGFGGGRGRGHENNDEYQNPYDARTGTYRNPSGYEGPPLGSAGNSRGGGGGRGGHHGGGGGGHHGGGGGFGGDFSNDYDFGPATDFEREAAAASREFDFSIPREFDPDVQLRNNNNNRGGGGGGHGHGGGGGHGHGGSGGRSGGHHHSHNPQYHQQQQPYHGQGANRRSGPHESASTRSDRQDDFDIGYNDYLRANFPEALNSPGFSTPSYSPGDSNPYEFRPNYYHRSRGNSNEQGQGHAPEISHSPSNHHGRGQGHHGGGNRGFIPDKEHTQPSHSFSPPPGFFTEDSPGYENYENLGHVMKDFSTKTRDGCQKVNKGDMTCYVCRDAKGMNKEECMYASNDPKNKAMAYHEVTEYSSPTVSVLPAPLHATLLGQQDTASVSQGGEGPLAAASSLFFVSTPKSTTGSSSSSTVTEPSITEKGKKKGTTPSYNDKGKNVRSVKSSRYAHASTVIVHERTKRSPNEEEYDFDY